MRHVHFHEIVFIQGPMSSCKACHGSHHLVEVSPPCRDLYFVVLQDPTVCEKCFGCLLQMMFHINMMEFGASCRQFTTEPFFTRVMFQTNNPLPRRELCWLNRVGAKLFRHMIFIDFLNNGMPRAKRRSSSVDSSSVSEILSREHRASNLS